MFKTITFGQGIEFANYRQLEPDNECKVYCYERYSPWQKGSNEYMNGRLSGTCREADIDRITQEEPDQLVTKMNRRPRRCLGYKIPQELFIQQYKNDRRIWF